MVAAERKFCTIIGGPNGSGKSTLFELLKPQGVFINADVVARRLAPDAPEAVSILAGRTILSTLEQVTAAGTSFVYETTLSSRQSISLMETCRSLGYEVNLVFIALESADLNVRRVAERVSRGGHHIPEDTIRRRFDASLRRLPDALRLADSCIVFDNSHLRPELLLIVEKGIISRNNLNEAILLHARLATAVEDAYGIADGAVLTTGRHS